MPEIKITVAGKIATNTTPGVVIVCGNSDYTVTFDLDAEWAAEAKRTARFVFYRDGLRLYKDVEFTGNTATAPVLSGIDYVEVGVYAGDLRTTTPARVLCDRSILCGDPMAVPPTKAEQLQAQITANAAAIMRIQENGTGSGLTPAAKTALLNCLAHVAWADENGQSYYDALATALESSGGGAGGDNDGPSVVTLTRISAVYSGGEVEEGTALTDLTGIEVTAHYSNGSTKTVTNYELSGEIVAGENIIAVSYGGLVTTFTVTGKPSNKVYLTFDSKPNRATEVYADDGETTLNGDNAHGIYASAQPVYDQDVTVYFRFVINANTTYTYGYFGSLDPATNTLYRAERPSKYYKEGNGASYLNKGNVYEGAITLKAGCYFYAWIFPSSVTSVDQVDLTDCYAYIEAPEAV